MAESGYEEPCSVFVRNLAYTTTDQTLETHFADVAPVKEAFVIVDKQTKRSRGFGFVSFVTHQDAMKAIETLKDKPIDNRKVTIDLARKKKHIDLAVNKPVVKQKNKHTELKAKSTHAAATSSQSSADAAPTRHRIIVRNLPFSCDADTLRAAFEPHCEVIDTHIPVRADGKHPGFGFVQVGSSEICASAVAAVNGAKIQGRIVVADVALNRAQYQKHACKNATETAEVTKPAHARVPGKGNGKGSIGAAPTQKKTQYEQHSSHDKGKANQVDDNDGIHDGIDENDGRMDCDNNESGESSDESDENDDKSSESDDDAGESADGEDSDSKKDTARSKIQKADCKKNVSDDLNPEESLALTIFVRSLPIQATKAQVVERFSSFGNIGDCEIVADPYTGISRGTAFVHFEKQESIDLALQASQNGGVRMMGHPLEISRAVERKLAARLSGGVEQPIEQTGEDDARNLSLARMGIVLSDDPGAKALTPVELQKREEAWSTKKEKLASSNFSVSATRLSVRNIPVHVTEDQLRAFALSIFSAGKDSVTPRFVRGKPIISRKHRVLKHVKIVRDTERHDQQGNLRSKGFGFVEFFTHAQAVTALEAMSDKPIPGARNSGRKLLVEFAVDSVQKLKLHEERKRRGAERQKREHEMAEGAHSVVRHDLVKRTKRDLSHTVKLPSASFTGFSAHGAGSHLSDKKRERKPQPMQQQYGKNSKHTRDNFDGMDIAKKGEEDIPDLGSEGLKGVRRKKRQKDTSEDRFDELVSEYKTMVGASRSSLGSVTKFKDRIAEWM